MARGDGLRDAGVTPLLATLPADGVRERTRGLHAVCVLIVRELERTGRLQDDRPELALATLERWIAGEDEPNELHDAMEMMVQASFTDREVITATRCVLWAMRVHVVDLGRGRDVARRVIADAISVLVELGEASSAAEARLIETYLAARG